MLDVGATVSAVSAVNAVRKAASVLLRQQRDTRTAARRRVFFHPAASPRVSVRECRAEKRVGQRYIPYPLQWWR